MLNLEQKYFKSTFPNYFQSTLNQFLNHNDPAIIFNVSVLSNKIYTLFQKYVSQPDFYHITIQILKQTLNKLRISFQDGNYSIKQLKQLLFLQLYLQKLSFKFSKVTQQSMQEGMLNKIIWQIRLDLQFSNIIDDAQSYMSSLLKFLQIEKSSQKFKKKIFQILEANQFTIPNKQIYFNIKREPLTQKIQNKIQQRNIFSKIQQRVNIVKNENKIIDHVKCDNYNLINSLKKNKQRKTITNFKSRTIYFSHPMKFTTKPQQRVHDIVQYVQPDACF